MAEIVPLTWPEDGPRILDLCNRASDYVMLDKGRAPDLAYVKSEMTHAPPSVPPHQIWCWGHMQADGSLDAIVTCLKGYYEPNDWYLGLLLLDQAVRNAGLGTQMARHVIEQAQADHANCVRIAVLDTNPRARGFWERAGFKYEKSMTGGDGHMRHVHRLPLGKAKP
ncbi:GNAT family N-acetyltransferase [Tateyamaria omphalii]|uniref:GNAT family N-acetyltransferase n=1 Tax=Tateyamaria omphalii TaxID=299262 RepID=UPI001C98F653|nr:GNAT family N-acetyltransferase [Tateyamaria omphalii]MBY5935512.1 GNAT family N-acetyltransferase [Tateyamaria omphalii]